jgi:outer membrane protein assembly factor BamB
MKRIACAGLAAALAFTAAPAQDRDYTWSSPAVPPREALDRLNLKLAWSAFVQTESKRDGLASVQLAGRLLLVQTKSGLVTAIDAENGQTRWRTRVGLAFQRPLPLAFNRKSVFVVNGTSLYGLDRETGAQSWELKLPDGVSTAPVAGDYQVYIGAATGRLSAYLLPGDEQASPANSSSEMASYLKGEDLAASYPTGTSTAQPLLAWQSLTRIRLEWAPVLGPAAILFASPAGEIVAMEKFPIRTRKATEYYRYPLTDGPIPVAPGHYEEMAYIGAEDSNVYAVAIDTGNVAWRFTAGTPIRRQPIATEKDVYVVAEKMGLARVNRASGAAAWSLPRGSISYAANLEADRFLAANPKFVYANDASGRLLVLDRATGFRLSTYAGTRDFTIPVSNAVNDRLYLAANNGLIVCLHDRDYPSPYRHARGEDRSVDPEVAEVEAKLSKPISQPEKELIALSTMLDDLLGEKNGNIKYRISENAFKEAGITGIEEKKVSLPKLTGVPLRDVLRRLLASVDANFQIIKDTILIYPNVKKTTP